MFPVDLDKALGCVMMTHRDRICCRIEEFDLRIVRGHRLLRG